MWKSSLLIVVFAIGSYCHEDITPFTTGGRLALYAEHSSDCSISSPFNIHCGGVVVDSRHILTSASCVMNTTTVGVTTTNTLGHPGWFRVMCGDNHLFAPSPGRFVSGVSHIYPHDEFVPNTNNHDLAILRLTDTITFPSNTIDPAVFEPLPLADATMCTYSGWGRASAQTTVVLAEKRVIAAPIVNRIICNGATMANPNRALENMVCAGLTATTGTISEATCVGNQGGALYFERRVVGILAFGTGCGAINAPGVYIQTRLYTNWRIAQLNRTDTIPAGTVYPRPA